MILTYKKELVMSGGAFDYVQFRLQHEAIDELKKIINENVNDKKYSDDTIEKFKIGLNSLELALIYLNRIDWLVSGDDSENTFHQRLSEDLNISITRK